MICLNSPYSKIFICIVLLWYLRGISSQSGECKNSPSKGEFCANECNMNKKEHKLVKCNQTMIDHYGCCLGKASVKDYPLANCSGLCLSGSFCILKENIPVPSNMTNKYECRKPNPYQNLTIWIWNKSRAARMNLTHHRLGQKCNTKLYEKRMAPIWQMYLTCPLDHSDPNVTKDHDYEHLFQVLKMDWHKNNDIMNQVCFSSLMEECYEGLCRCLQRIYTYDTRTHEIYAYQHRKKWKNDTSDKAEIFISRFHVNESITKKEIYAGEFENDTKMEETMILDYTQYREHSHCGLDANTPCTHNVEAMQKICKIPASEGLLYPGEFTCESDSMCELKDWDANVCKLNETCLCACAVGYACHGQGTRLTLSENYYFIAIIPILLIYSWNMPLLVFV